MTLAGFALVATLAYPLLSISDIFKQFVTAPAVTSIAAGLLATYVNRRDVADIRYSALHLARVLNWIWLFFPLSLATYACVVMFATESYEGLRWIGPAPGMSIGQQVADRIHAARQDRSQ